MKFMIGGINTPWPNLHQKNYYIAISVNQSFLISHNLLFEVTFALAVRQYF